MKKTATLLATLAVALSTGVSTQAAELRMSWWGGDSRHIATQEALKICGDKYGHTISPEFTGFNGHLEKLTTQLAGGTEADIMQVNWPWLPLFSKNGDGLADLGALSDIIDLSNWTEEQLASGSMKGVLNGLPVSTTGRVFMFNEGSYEAAGVAVPTTWGELLAATPAFKEKLGDEAYPFDATTLDVVLLVSMVTTQATGKDLVDPATNTVAWTAEELAKGIAFYQNLVDTGTIRSWEGAAASGTDNLWEMPEWADGHLAGSYQWDSTYSKYADPITVGHLVPVGILTIDGAVTEGVYRKPSMTFAISKRSKDPQAAAQVLNCLLNEPEGIAAMSDQRGLPSSKAALAELEKLGKIDPTLKAANDIVMAGSGPTVSPYNEDPQVRDTFQSTLEEFAYGQLSAMEAAEIIIDGINGRLAEL
ncbi:MAG: ABC transporter substrate-binding protein [Alphaproteobacteria bacterium]|nr:ABC transporter substrate-binding protein [Alphaproteobacteria bacterium]